jgi:hypothetical protein
LMSLDVCNSTNLLLSSNFELPVVFNSTIYDIPLVFTGYLNITHSTFQPLLLALTFERPPQV